MHPLKQVEFVVEAAHATVKHLGLYTHIVAPSSPPHSQVGVDKFPAQFQVVVLPDTFKWSALYEPTAHLTLGTVMLQHVPLFRRYVIVPPSLVLVASVVEAPVKSSFVYEYTPPEVTKSVLPEVMEAVALHNEALPNPRFVLAHSAVFAPVPPDDIGNVFVDDNADCNPLLIFAHAQA